jgi:hypothetical protein
MRHDPRSGFAIVAATFVMVVLIALATTLSDITVSSTRQTQARGADSILSVTTESVANLAFSHLQNLTDLDNELNRAQVGTHDSELTDNVGTLGVSGAGTTTLNGLDQRVTWKCLGTMTVPILGENENLAVYRIDATVGAGGPAKLYNSDGSENPIEDVNRYRRRRVEAIFIRYPSSYFKQAMFARNGFEYKGAATTDSWNSGDGTSAYGSTAHGSNGDLSSEGLVVVQKPENVQGDANSYVKLPIPPLNYQVPGGATSLGAYATVKNSPPTWGAFGTTSVFHATSFTVKAETINITPGAKVDIYVDTFLRLETDWVIPMSPDPAKPTEVRIFQNDYDSALGGTSINGNITLGCTQRPRSFQIYSLYDGRESGVADQTPWDWSMNGTAVFGGTVFAPYLSMKLNGGADMYGSIICESFRDNNELGKVNGSFSFHYDESLGDIPLPFPPTLVVVGWRSLDLGLNRWQDAAGTIPWDEP